MKHLSLLFCLGLAVLYPTTKIHAADAKADNADDCLDCHENATPGLFKQWKNSEHGKQNITCSKCHGAKEGEPDAFEHNGHIISILVTPRDCGQCHPKQAEEVGGSHHAKAGQILESQDSYLAHIAGGHPAAIQGCESCHGAKMKIDEKAGNKMSKETWPNSGIGRINPDGSLGACNACHTRHSFSKAQARQPEACSKCHLGPDHPQREIYEESKHGNVYATRKDEMNLKSKKWVVGVDYFEAPTCATCHMSATETQPLSHDVGARISWTLRPEISVNTENWKKKRANMKDVCATCHTPDFVDGHYYQYDATVRLYNEKFAKPAKAIMEMIRKKGLLKNPASFGNEVEWVYWELWHHEGRRARHGAAMMGPDYTWWHGMYEVAHNFYFKFLPEARHFQDTEINQFIDKLLTEDEMHKWLNTPTADLKAKLRSGQIQKVYEKLFDKETKP